MVGSTVLGESLSRPNSRPLRRVAFVGECIACRDIVLQRLAVPASSLRERLDRREPMPGIELVPAGGAIRSFPCQPVVFRAQIESFHGHALGPRGLLGFFGRLYLLLCHTKIAI